MKPTLGSRMAKGKAPSMYQEYRSRTKSELDCSELLSGISELDNQMSKYDQLRKQRLSQSFIESEDPVPNMRASMRVESTPFDLDPPETLYAPLVPILEFQKPKPANKPPSVALTSKSTLNARPADKMGPPSMRMVEQGKSKEEKRERANALRLKAKQLQQQFLELCSGDILKKSTINKEFGVLLKLLQ